MKKGILIHIILIGFVFQLAAQKIDSALNELANSFPSEKIYIHYDKEYYVAGETIWFKAYLYSDGKPSGLSNNFYLQFTDSKGQPISNKKYPILGAVVKGEIAIPDSLPQGNYTIRALTPRMLNDDEAFIYKKGLFIYNPGVNNTTVTVKPESTISLKFFPESGNLVNGILSVVGFKAVDQWGIPVDVKGIIRTDDGATVASFQSFHDGIGKVQFVPQAGKKYSAEVETNNGPRTYALPDVQGSGINLKIQNEKGGKLFLLSRSEKDKEQFENLLLVVEMNNRVVYENEIVFEDYPSVQGHLVTDSLPSGILHFTVFNKDGAPLAERLCFVDNAEYYTPAGIIMVKTGIEKRSESIFELSFPEALQRSCSVAVIDLPGYSLNNEDNIFSRFLLTGDLKGDVFNPAYYFTYRGLSGEKQNDSIRQALDNLMLTHGWSRFNWTKILSKEFPERKYNDHYLISLSGVVKDGKTKELLSGGKLNVYLEVEDSTTLNYELPVDTKGGFKIDSLAFLGKAKLFYAYTDNQGKSKPALVFINDNLTEKAIAIIPGVIAENGNNKNVLPKAGKEEIDTRFRYEKTRLDQIKELERVTLRAKSNKKPIDIVNEKYTTGVFRDPGKVDIDNINDPANDKSMSVVDYIKNRIQQVEMQGGQFVNRKNMSLMTGQKWLIGVFLNEVPTDISLLRTIPVDNVALIKFYEAGFIGVGSGFPGGAIAVYTKEKQGKETRPDKLNYVEYNGYSIAKEFYSPDYSVANVKQPAVDNRTTLYWNPNVYTDAKTKSLKFNFFNNDLSKKLRIVVEGFDADGKLIHIEKIIGDN